MEVRFLEPARAEFREAIAFYDAQRDGLGSEFASEINDALQRIIQYPKAWTPLSARTRRCLTKRFPYGIIYQIRDTLILVIAVMHLHRDPETWKSRVAPRQR